MDEKANAVLDEYLCNISKYYTLTAQWLKEKKFYVNKRTAN